MNHLKDFKKFNEGISMGTLLVGGLAIYFLYKFLKGLFKSISENNRKKQYLNDIIREIEYAKNKMSDKIGITDLNDRYFVRIQTKLGLVDFRIFKNTKEMLISAGKNDTRFQLTDEQYEDFLKVVKPS
jgi:hypothetical protein